MAPNHPFHPQARRRRAGLATMVIGLMLVSLGSAYFRTQIVQNADFTLRSNNNRLRAIAIPAARGAIYDRNGRPIAETVTTYSLSLDALSPEETERVLGRIRDRLALSDSAVAALLKQRRSEPRKPLPVAKDLSFDQVSWLEEHRTELPAIRLDAIPLRRYPQGEAVAHLVGYVGEISERELEDSVHWAGYEMGQMVGKAGIEREYDRVLGGEDGERYVEVDARGKVIGTLAPSESKPAVAGRDIHLTIDVALQRFAHSIWPEDMNGAVVAMVPSTGEVLALYSHPTFDPNQLVGGIPRELWRSLNSDERHPLVDRATIGIYPPGSTFKIATALIGLERGVITPTTRMPLPCTGGMSYAGRYSRCWKPEGHGYLDLAGAIANSCNVYFYQLGIWLGLNRLAAEGTRLGFSRRTGLDLPSEASGTFPASVDWYRKRFGWTPTPSEVMSLAIGQGPNAQTPLRVAQFFSALAGDGTAPSPHLLKEPPSRKPETDLRVSPATLKAVRVGLARVTEPGGTAYASSLKRWKLYGKTGSSQNSQDPNHTHAWFAGFAGPPDGEPEIAVAAVVEFGGHGGVTAAPIAAKVADFYLNEIHGLPTDPKHQTLAERQGRN